MKHLRQYIRLILSEADGFGCNAHSLGFIDNDGAFYDLEGFTHQYFLDMNGLQKVPAGWIKVSNANELWLIEASWNQVTGQQINGLIDMWIACSQHSNWIKSDIENFYVTFGQENEGVHSAEEFTVPEFIKLYGSNRHMDKLFGALL